MGIKYDGNIIKTENFLTYWYLIYLVAMIRNLPGIKVKFVFTVYSAKVFTLCLSRNNILLS